MRWESLTLAGRPGSKSRRDGRIHDPMSYEVWCHSCNVTFPTGTKTCLHCGSRTRPDRPHLGNMRRRAEPDMTSGALSFADDAEAIRSLPDLPPIASTAAIEPEEGPARRSLLRAGMTVMWMILLAAGYAWRACSQ